MDREPFTGPLPPFLRSPPSEADLWEDPQAARPVAAGAAFAALVAVILFGMACLS